MENEACYIGDDCGVTIEDPFPDMAASPAFEYKKDIHISQDYNIQELLDLSDEKFNNAYQQYEIDVANMIKYGGFKNAWPMINVMERIVLERRLARVEKQLAILN